jgi:WD40 repeat protein
LFELYQKSAAGAGNDEPVLLEGAGRAVGLESSLMVPTDWSSDGRQIIFSAASTSNYDLWLLPMGGDRKPVKFLSAPSDEMHGNFSPDGRLVAYSSNESGAFEVYVESLPRSDRKWTVSTNGGYEPRWRADGREIFDLAEDHKLMAVSVGPGPSFTTPKPLFQTRVGTTSNPTRTNYVPSRDGQRFLVNQQVGDPAPNPITVVLNWTAGLKR